MSTNIAYTYVMLRYVHDTTTGEFVNVGIALHAPESRYAGAICRTTYGRLSKVFPGINHDHFKSLMRYIQGEFEGIGERLRDQLPLEQAGSVLDLARAVLPSDDSSLQWSPVGSGLSTDPAATLEKLFDRMVMRYEERDLRERRSEDEVWRHFKRNLETRQLLRYFEPRTIAVKDDEIEFKHTWQNGVLHCLEPVSFDLVSAEGIRDKAHRWLGRVASVVNDPGADPFRLYFLVGAPQDEALMDAYESALSILKKVPVEKQIFGEQEADQLGQLLSGEVEKHLAGAH